MAKKAAKPEAAKETKKAAKAPKAEAKEKAPKKAEKVAAAPEEPKAEKPAKAPKAPKVPKISAKVKKMEEAAAAAAAESNKKWSELKEKHGSDKAVNYTMSGTFKPETPLQHKVLGWGFIISNNNDRLEVLFEAGTKMLISNYQAK